MSCCSSWFVPTVFMVFYSFFIFVLNVFPLPPFWFLWSFFLCCRRSNFRCGCFQISALLEFDLWFSNKFSSFFLFLHALELPSGDSHVFIFDFRRHFYSLLYEMKPLLAHTKYLFSPLPKFFSPEVEVGFQISTKFSYNSVSHKLGDDPYQK